MLGSELQSAAVYTDFQGLSDLRHKARDNSPEALEAVARQFESIFMQMMLKSMREASLGDGLFDSQQSELYLDMYDKQLATSLSSSGSGVGLAEVMIRQLRQSLGSAETAAAERTQSYTVPERVPFSIPAQPASPATAEVQTVEPSASAAAPLSGEPQEFVRELLPHAERAAQRLGVRPEVLLAQAALETGWGRAVIRHGDGRSSHNLFNIKSDQRWGGMDVAKQTLEYRDGVASKEMARFRAYNSYAESFEDYVDFISQSPRYARAMENAADPQAYLDELQQAGYATDPEYAGKIKEILNRPELLAMVGELKLSGNGTLTNGRGQG